MHPFFYILMDEADAKARTNLAYAPDVCALAHDTRHDFHKRVVRQHERNRFTFFADVARIAMQGRPALVRALQD